MLLPVVLDRRGSTVRQDRGRSTQGRGVHASRGRGGRQQAQGRNNNLTWQDAQNHPDLIMGTLNVLGLFARVLIDCGATHSVISHTFAQLTQPQSTPLGYELEFSMSRGEKFSMCSVSYVYLGCPVLIEDVVMPANLLPLDLADFDVIWEQTGYTITMPTFTVVRRR